MKPNLRFGVTWLCMGVLLTGCVWPLPQAPAGPQAWIDAPLDHSIFPVGPVQVVTHGSDPGGIVQIEVSANGQPVAPSSNPSGGQSLVTQKQTWNPEAPGEYLLRARAQNNAGAWSPYASEIVIITGGNPTITPVIPTPTSTATATPTMTPTGVALGSVTVERISNDLIYIGRSGCGPLEVTIAAHATAPKGIAVVVLFYRFEYDGAPSGFQNVAMSSLGGDLYQYTLNPTSLLGSVLFDQATLQYQIVVQQKDGDTTIRTPVLADIAVKACGPVAPPPAACSSYTDKRSCIAHGCKWVALPGIVPVYSCQNP